MEESVFDILDDIEGIPVSTRAHHLAPNPETESFDRSRSHTKFRASQRESWLGPEQIHDESYGHNLFEDVPLDTFGNLSAMRLARFR